ncbi:T9SS type A sorting domain-containing protein [Gramella lutea]|uniref:T9SS type A sorting domain-containing protein n=1 Tax=Christiangramia lutea TaxID=1607951 RepID=A0A9X1V3C1_9FLAO|nr:T9SS type A sorting domain-containing protein [Christiangramia lutea]MCH4823354.1 T9SS type A sorting domain-containing protein [Christiangramia lutea]
MKLPLLFSMIFSISGLYAQLYIAPSEKSDSYVYVKDRVLFVQDEVHLIENKKDKLTPNIYLRKGSQLLQGDKDSSENKGSGKLSVYQTGTSNAYDYNYWSIPVFVNGGRLDDYIYEPQSNLISKRSNLISGLDGQSTPLNISNRWIYTFSGNNYSNWLFAGDNFDLLPGEGFSMKGVNGNNPNLIDDKPINSGSSQTYDFRGIPGNGLIELPIKKEQVLLVGNPYPSALDLNKFLIENTATTGIAYFWDSRENGNSHYLADYEGGYGTYSPGTGVYVPPVFKKYSDGSETGTTGKYYERKISPIAQGFMIMGRTEGMISFKNSHRLYQKQETDISVFKSSENNMSLNLIIEIDSTYIQKLALVFRPDASTEEDHAMDARKMNINPKDISWGIGNQPFVVNVRPKISEELIPLKVSIDQASELKFSISDLQNFDPARVFIYDSRDDLYFNIKTGYLKMHLEMGEYTDRFFFSFIENQPEETTKPVIGSPSESIDKPENILLNSIEIFQNNFHQQLEVKMLYDSEISSLRLYDLNGKIIYAENFRLKNKEFNLPTANLSNAVYIVKVNTTDNKELTKKIGVKN